MNERRDIFEETRGKWPSILPMFGVPPQALSGKSVPCPMCGGRDRFTFTDREGAGIYICRGCGNGNGMTLLMKMNGISFREAATEIRAKLHFAEETKPKPRMSAEKARRLCVELWKESLPIREGDDAWKYLVSRGIEPSYGQQLRFHPEVPVKNHPDRVTLPAMLARVSDNSGVGVNIHRTYLFLGQKAGWCDRETGDEVSPKKMMPGAISPDAAIRLFPHEGVLGVSEGIETALAVHRDYGIPCWSLINSTHMSKWTWPKGIKELHVFGDNDAKFGGQAAAYALAHRVACRPDAPAVFVRIPDRVGVDWAD